MGTDEEKVNILFRKMETRGEVIAKQTACTVVVLGLYSCFLFKALPGYTHKTSIFLMNMIVMIFVSCFLLVASQNKKFNYIFGSVSNTVFSLGIYTILANIDVHKKFIMATLGGTVIMYMFFYVICVRGANKIAIELGYSEEEYKSENYYNALTLIARDFFSVAFIIIQIKIFFHN